MSVSGDEPTRITRGATTRVVDRVASLLPTVRARLFALVVMALVPALVILGYDEWRARERGFTNLTDLAQRIVRLLQREMDDRITRSAHRLQVLSADSDVISLAPAATRKLVDALRDDQLYNNLLIADGATGDVRSSAVPLDRTGERARTACVRPCPPHARTRHGRLPSRSDHARAGPEPRTTRRERYRHADVGRPGKRRHRLGPRVHRTLRTAREHGPDRDRRQGHRPVPIPGARQVCGEAGGSLRHGPWRDRHECPGRAGLDGVERLYVATALEVRGQPTGSRITLGIALAPYRAAMNAGLRRSLGLLAMATMLCLFMAWLVGEALFLREVRPILATARRVGAGDLEARTGFG